jgi:DNA-binding LacI/PurR family transcriptional regulator
LDSFPESVEKGDVFFLQTGKLTNALAEFCEILKNNNLEVGKDVGLMAYNDVPLYAVVLGGLTTISTDFAKMGKLAAEMILSGKMTKIHNDFRMIRRKTF